MKRYKSRFEEARNTFDELEWIVVINDDSNNAMGLGFKTEKQAEYAKDYYENISDITIFQVDYYGKTDKETLEKYITSNYNAKYIEPNAKLKSLQKYVYFIS